LHVEQLKLLPCFFSFAWSAKLRSIIALIFF